MSDFSRAGYTLWHRLLQALLRLEGTVMALALIAVFIPTSWMVSANESLGLAPLPEQPLTEYLTRSLSALYAFHGALAWLASMNVRRLAPLVTFFGVSDVLLGPLLFGIDLFAGMPIYWAWSELLVPFLGGVAVLWLQWMSRRSDAANGITGY